MCGVKVLSLRENVLGKKGSAVGALWMMKQGRNQWENMVSGKKKLGRTDY